MRGVKSESGWRERRVETPFFNHWGIAGCLFEANVSEMFDFQRGLGRLVPTVVELGSGQ